MLRKTQTIVLVSMMMPQVLLAMDVFVDFCEPGQIPRRIAATVDPDVQSYRFFNWLFRNYNFDHAVHRLLHNGKQIDPDCRLGEYRNKKDKNVYLVMQRSDSTAKCYFKPACAP